MCLRVIGKHHSHSSEPLVFPPSILQGAFRRAVRVLILLKMTTFPASTRQKLRAAGAVHGHGAAAVCRMSRLLETWCLMEYAEKGSLADALRTGRLRRPSGFPELGVIIACLQDIASGMLTNMSPVLSQSWAPLLPVLQDTSLDGQTSDHA